MTTLSESRTASRTDKKLQDKMYESVIIAIFKHLPQYQLDELQPKERAAFLDCVTYLVSAIEAKDILSAFLIYDIERALRILRHALGLDRSKTSYRNWYDAPPDHYQRKYCEVAVTLRLMTYEKQYEIFRVTRLGRKVLKQCSN